MFSHPGNATFAPALLLYPMLTQYRKIQLFYYNLRVNVIAGGGSGLKEGVVEGCGMIYIHGSSITEMNGE